MNVAYSTVLIAAFLKTGIPVFEVDIWPGEGRPVFEATSKVLYLHERPSASSRISKTLAVAAAQRLSFDDTRYQTIKAGRIRVLGATRVTGRVIGAVNRLSRDEYYFGKFASASMDIRPGVTLEYLQYRAEGTCFIRMAGRVIDAEDCPANDKSLFNIEAEPTVEWWIHVVLPGNSGWLLVDDSSVKQVDREL
jgi:hypothetical protein